MSAYGDYESLSSGSRHGLFRFFPAKANQKVDVGATFSNYNSRFASNLKAEFDMSFVRCHIA